MAGESLIFKSGVDPGAFVAGLNVMGKAAAASAKSITGTFSGIGRSITSLGSVFGVSLGAAAFASGVKGAFDLGNKLGDLSKNTGIAVKNLLPLQQAMKDAGMDAEQLRDMMTELQSSLGKSEGVFTGGLLRALKDLSPDQQFVAIGKAINGIENPAKRAAAAVSIFNEEGTKLLAVFADPRFGTTPPAMEAQAALLERNAAMFSSVSEKLARSGSVARGFFLGIAEEAAPAMEKMLTKWEGINMIAQGRGFAQFMTKAANDIGPILRKMAELYNKVNGAYGGAMAYADKINEALYGKPSSPAASNSPKGGSGGADPNKAGRALPPDFWKGKDPRKGIFSGADPRDPKSGFIGGKRGIDGRVDDNQRRFGPDALADDEFRQRFMPSGSPEALERWGKRMGVQNGAYNKIRSRNRAERDAEKANAEKLDLSKDTIKELNNGVKEAVKEIVSK